MKQSTWETWFIVSAILFFSFFFVGTLLGSVQLFPNFWKGFAPVIINLVVCVYIGFTSQSSKK